MGHLTYHTVGGNIKLLRAEWFEVGSDKWYPLEEDLAKQIEEAHRLTTWRTKVNYIVHLSNMYMMQTTFGSFTI